MPDESKIPLCRSEWLQDVSIELGRRFGAHCPFRSFFAEVDNCEHDGECLERMTVWASTWYGTGVKLTLWENGTVWIGVTLRAAENNPEYEVGFDPLCRGFTSERLAEAFRDTVAVSTRLCYGETPLPILRRVWNHTGSVKETGTLNAARKAQSGVSPNGRSAEPRDISKDGGEPPLVN